MIDKELRVVITEIMNDSLAIRYATDLYKAKEDIFNQAISKIKALVVKSLGKNKVYLNHIQPTCGCRQCIKADGKNQHIAEMKQKWGVKE